MLKHIAVRLRRSGDADIAFKPRASHENQRNLVESRLEVRDLALKNFAEALHSRGLDYFVDDCKLSWYQVDDENTVAYYQAFNEVECAFESDWWEHEKNRIRYYQGMRYVDECRKLAGSFEVKNQSRAIDYQLP